MIFCTLSMFVLTFRIHNLGMHGVEMRKSATNPQVYVMINRRKNGKANKNPVY